MRHFARITPMTPRIRTATVHYPTPLPHFLKPELKTVVTMVVDIYDAGRQYLQTVYKYSADNNYILHWRRLIHHHPMQYVLVN